MTKKLKTTGIHKINTHDAIALMQSNKSRGLKNNQVKERQKQYGPNRLPGPHQASLLLMILKQLTNPLASILLLALGLTIFLHEYIDAGVILFAVLINLFISLYQERKAGEAFRLLSENRIHQATVIRDSNKQLLSIDELVPGDIVELQAGAYVPADGRILSENRLSVSQVMFTGEANAIAKNNSTNDERHIFDRANLVFMGSTVVTGSGLMVVTDTALHTQLGKIANELVSIEKNLSPIQQSMKTIALWLGVFTMFVLFALVAVGLSQGLDFYDVLLLAVAVGVAAVPEGLLAAVTVVLAFGARSIMKHGGLIKNLSSTETLGSVTYILTDKTGTLTFGSMKVENWYVSGGNYDSLKHAAGLALDVFYDVKKHRYVGDEMDTALAKNIYTNSHLFEQSEKEYQKIDTIPFDSQYKFYSSLRKKEDEYVVYTKGAPELLINHAQYIEEDGTVRPITDDDRRYFIDIQIKQSAEGRRLLAVAIQKGVDKNAFKNAWDTQGAATLGSGLVLCGLVSFYDKVRSDVPKVINNLQEKAGTQVVMITGDSAGTAHRIALEAGIIDDQKAAVYSGEDIDANTDEHLLEIIRSGQAKVFARVTPTHKLRLVSILQDAGEIVAMTGDGVNDAAALSKATIGISLSSSTEVAQESADLVLLDDSFSTIAYAVEEGRRMMGNLKKTIIYLLSASFSEVFVLMGSLALSGPVPFYPTQILWANIIEEGLMNFAFIFEPAERYINRKKFGEKMVGSHTRNMVIGIGLLNGLILFVFYILLLQQNISEDLMRTYMFAALSIDSVFLGLSLKSLYDPIWRVKLFSNLYLIIASVISFALLVLALATPFMRSVLHLEQLSLLGFGVILLFAMVNLLSVELVKKLLK